MREVDIRWLMDPEAPDLEPVPGRARRPQWHRKAACRGMGTAAFFPARGASMAPAYALCDGCPVKAECLAAAMAEDDCRGVWGGTTSQRRRQLRQGSAA